MKLIYSFMALAMSLFSFNEVAAQLKVHSNGNVLIKRFAVSDIPRSELSIDTIGNGLDRVSIKGDNTAVGAYRNSGVYYSDWTYGVNAFNDTYTGGWAVGIKGAAFSMNGRDSNGRAFGVLGIGGGASYGYNYGVYGTCKYYSRGAGIVGTCNGNLDLQIQGSYAGYFDGPVNVTGPLSSSVCITSSDKRIKKNVSKFKKGKALEGILAMEPVEYNLTQRYSTVDNDTAKMSVPRYEEQSPLMQKKQYGLIAQDLQAIYPDLVYEDAEGYLSINYIGIIPLLIESVKELEAEVAKLSKGNPKKQIARSSTESLSFSSELFQNVPNPFTASTTIKYSIDSEVKSASILLFDMQGLLLETYPITQRGNGSLILQGGSLSPGMYIYSLIADDREVDSKRMILTK